MSRTDTEGRPLIIPSRWTPAQADAVFEFLAYIVDQVYLAYEEHLTELALRDALGQPPDDPDPPDPSDDDPIPF